MSIVLTDCSGRGTVNVLMACVLASGYSSHHSMNTNDTTVNRQWPTKFIPIDRKIDLP